MALDLLDRKLLFELDKDSRQTNKALAKKLRTSPEVIRYRIKRLEDEGIIKYYMAIISPETLGYFHYEVYLKYNEMKDEDEKELIFFLSNRNNILWLSSCIGHYDLVFSVIAKDNLEFSSIIEDVLNRFGKRIQERNIQVTVQIPHFTRNYLIGKKLPDEISYRSGRQKREAIDKIDFSIISFIMDHGRDSLIDMSRSIGISVDMLKYRLKALEKKGVIKAYRPFIDKEKIGHQLVQVLLRFRSLNGTLKRRFIEFARQLDKTVYILDTIGNFDMILEIEPKDSNETNSIVKSIRNEFSDNLLGYATITITKEHQMHYFKVEEKDFFT